MLSRLLWVVSLYIIYSFNILSIELNPVIFRFSLETPKTQELSVINSKDKSARYRVSLQRPENQKDPDLYMGEWVRYYPKILSVPPKSTRVVRFRVTPPKGKTLKDGEYRAYLILEELPKKEDMVTAKGNTEKEGNQMDLKLNTMLRYSLSLYGEKGEIKPQLEFEKFKITQDKEKQDRIRLKSKVTNRGNTSQRTAAYITFKKANGEKSKEPTEVVLPICIRENTAIIDVPVDKPEEDIQAVDILIRYWAPNKIGDIVIEQKNVRL